MDLFQQVLMVRGSARPNIYSRNLRSADLKKQNLLVRELTLPGPLYVGHIDHVFL